MDKLLASKNWLAKAKDDLKWTEANIREKIWYGACFTAQQSAEKALKAYLISQGKETPKIHDLGALLEYSNKLDTTFKKLKSACAVLTDYYSPARYPDISQYMVFSKQNALEALNLATRIVDFVEKKIQKN